LEESLKFELQGHPIQSGFIEKAMTDRNIQFEVSLKVFLKSWYNETFENVRQTSLAKTVSEIWFFLYSTYGSFL